MIKLDKKTILHKCRIAFKKRWLVVGSVALFSILFLCLANLDRFEFGIILAWLTKDESGSATIRNIGLLVLAVVGMPFAIWRSVVAGRQADIAQRGLCNEYNGPQKLDQFISLKIRSKQGVNDEPQISESSVQIAGSA